MKINFKILSLISTCLMCLSTAHAYKYVIFTDEVSGQKAQEVSDMLKTTYPFNQFEMNIEIVKLQPKELKCGSQSVERKVACSNAIDIQRKTLRLGGDQAMIVKDLDVYGGTSTLGGGIPVITTSTSIRAMLHEYMHTLGICDEYEYPANEARMFCSGSSSPNLVYINPLDPYTADTMAKSKHMKEIRWSKYILSKTAITHNQGTLLGTGEVKTGDLAPHNTSLSPQVLIQPIALYKGKLCNKARKQRVSWHPGSQVTVMENLNAGLGAPLEKIVENIMISKGAKFKVVEATLIKDPILVPKESVNNDIVDAESNTKINNTPKLKIKRIDNGDTVEMVPAKTMSR